MKRLYKKNYEQGRTIQGYAVTCKNGCACICQTCTCLGPDFLHVSDRRAKHAASATGVATVKKRIGK